MVVHQNACNDCVKVNKIAYALLAILLGWIGIHRFYARRFVSGILYIFFCWTTIPAILGIVEGIVALTEEDDGNGFLIVYPDKYFV
ncbi:TM2 domain-containing protein [Candidatus Methanarcanum hacksteinii]|uniref:TM2 domain-containing protein n=1 Tax=Candidatus Methanarcanum hacksteinii TaxID=2911857 RepID=UPI0037DD8547